MSTSKFEKYSPEFFRGIKKATEGQFDIKINGKKHSLPVSHAEIREKDIVLRFDLSGGNPEVNHLISIIIEKQYLNKKVEFTGGGEPVYFLFQNAKQEWLAEKGWIHVDWQENSKKITGLVDDVESGRPGDSKLEQGKFEVTLA
ncbi:hypothetical protein C3E97_006395 [Pseudomonas sp. MWU12-2115]|uniref:hypothetical protein n=1 Tax=unclassified Pseudomonas TaxID=196821 RepID=UPI000CD59E4C|nr:hypothetical protein [Pseudomonas sp. MWU12-2020]RBC02398.1 hypothetical protein C3E97_006395 [Pseudomonas sp. MWU12-2115]